MKMKWLHNNKEKSAYAFFDVDNTLISIKSMFSFLDYLWSKNEDLYLNSEAYRLNLNEMIKSNMPREEINAFYYTIFKNISTDYINELSNNWYQEVKQEPNFFITDVVNILNQHKELGHGVILVSGSAQPLLYPLAKDLNVDGIISAPLEIVKGRYTGRLLSEPTIGQGKANYIRLTLSNIKKDPSVCFAYGDDISDVPMLKSVGQAAMVNPTKESADLCNVFGWGLIQAA